MSEQPGLFHEDIWQALRDCVSAMGGSKDVGYRMRPELGPEKAGRWLLDCLNPDRTEKLGIEQLLFLLAEARRADVHIAMEHIARECGYDRPVARCPAAEREQLMLLVQRQAKDLQAALSRLEIMGAATNPGSKL